MTRLSLAKTLAGLRGGWGTPIALAIALLVVGCAADDNPPGRIPGALGAICPDDICKPGYVCGRDGYCHSPGDPGAVQEDRPCAEDAQCLPGLICGTDRECHRDEGAVEGQACGEGVACRDDFVCAGDGTCRTEGAPGTGTVGTPCEADVECAAGYACGRAGACVREGGPAVGEPCAATAPPCRDDLTCAGDDTCQAPGSPGTLQEDEPCVGPESCSRPWVCSVDGRCADPEQGGALGAPCLPEELVERIAPLVPPVAPPPPGPCLPHLACAYSGEQLEILGEPVLIDGQPAPVGQCREPGEPGTAGFGDECVEMSECRLGYACLFGACIRPVSWAGETCGQDDDPSVTPVAYFRVPRDDETQGDFFELPFPNDARLDDEGGVDMRGFPEPSEIIPDTTLRRNLDDLQGRRGFGLASSAFFRFSALPDVDSMHTPEGEPARLSLVDVDPESPAFGERMSIRWAFDSRRGSYICRQHLQIMPMPNGVFRPATTYAAVVTKQVRRDEGGPFARDPDFEAMLSDATPADSGLARAHGRYGKLRAWLALEDTPASDEILVATVFTTDDPTAIMASLRGAVRALDPPPLAENLMRCGVDTPSACPTQPGVAGRGCPPAEHDAFFELHGTVSAPIFQAGERPYLTPDDGGELAVDAAGAPVLQGREDLCFALTVPRGATMPEGGWPVVIYAHGTGGSFRSFVDQGVAEELTAVDIGPPEGGEGDGVQRFAVLSFDGVMHGPRRGSDLAPEDLLFNVRNPAAARDNSLQGGADLFTVARMVEELEAPASTSPLGEAIAFDPTKVFFVGHSQGGVTGALAVPFEPAIHSAVLSGTGGGVIISLLDKRSPFDLSAGVQLVLAESDPEFVLDLFHPALSMLQWYADAADPASYARWWFKEPKRVAPPHLFMTFGVGDTYTPPRAMHHLARSLGVHVAGAIHDEGHRLFARELPVRRNKPAGDSARVTAALQQFKPADGEDGHFVMLGAADARRKYRSFLAIAARDGVPTLVE